jgi:hypothetical protein
MYTKFSMSLHKECSAPQSMAAKSDQVYIETNPCWAPGHDRPVGVFELHYTIGHRHHKASRNTGRPHTRVESQMETI